MTIEIYKNNIWSALEIPDGLSLSLFYNSGILDPVNIPGSYSLSFTFYNSDYNNRLTGFIKFGEFAKFKCKLKLQGLVMLEGSLDITALDKTLKATIFIENGALINDVLDKNLQDFDYGGERTWSWLTDYTPQTSDFALYPVSNPNFFKDTFLDDGAYVHISNAWDGGNKRFVYLNERVSDKYSVTPFPYLNYVIKHIVNISGYNLKTSIFETDAELATLNIWNNYNIVEANAPAGSSSFTFELDKFNLKNHVPNKTVLSFLQDLKTSFNLAFIMTNGELSIVSINDIIKGTEIIDITDKVVSDISQEKEDNYYEDIELGFNLDSADEISANCKDIYAYTIDDYNNSPPPDPNASINSTPGTLTYVYDYNHNVYKCIVDYSTFPVLSKDLELYSRFEFASYHTSFGDYWFDWYYPNRQKLNTTKNLVLKTNMMPVTNLRSEDLEPIGNLWLPETGMIGCNFMDRDINKLESLRLIFYRGKMQYRLLDTSISEYPFASADLYDNKDDIAYNYRLRFINELTKNGVDISKTSQAYIGTLFHSFWEDYINWYLTGKKKHTINIKLSPAEIKNFDYTKKYRIGENLYFIPSFEVQITGEVLSPVKATIYEAPAY